MRHAKLTTTSEPEPSNLITLPAFLTAQSSVIPALVDSGCYERIALGMSVYSERWDLVLVRSAGKERLDLVLVRSAGSDVRCCGNIKEKTVVTVICTLVSNAIISINL